MSVSPIKMFNPLIPTIQMRIVAESLLLKEDTVPPLCYFGTLAAKETEGREDILVSRVVLEDGLEELV